MLIDDDRHVRPLYPLANCSKSIQCCKLTPRNKEFLKKTRLSRNWCFLNSKSFIYSGTN